MEKHCDSKKRFGNEENGTDAMNRILENFIRDYGAKAYRFAYNLSGNVEEAKDLVQETLYRVMRTWERYDKSQPLGAWFFTILRNVFLDSRKHASRRLWVALDAPIVGNKDGVCYGDILSDNDGNFLRRMENEEKANFAWRILQGLRTDQRTILNLREIKGLRYDEIASSLGIPMGTVRSRVFRARKALRDQSRELVAA